MFIWLSAARTYHIFDETFARLPQLLQVAKHMEAVLLFGQFQVCVDCYINAGPATAITSIVSNVGGGDSQARRLQFALYTLFPTRSSVENETEND